MLAVLRPATTVSQDAAMRGARSLQTRLAESTAPFDGCFGTGTIDQDPPHRFGCRPKKVPRTIPFFRFAIGNVNQSPVSLVNKVGRLQRLSRLLQRQSRFGQSPQFFVNNRQEFRGGHLIPASMARSICVMFDISIKSAARCCGSSKPMLVSKRFTVVPLHDTAID